MTPVALKLSGIDHLYAEDAGVTDLDLTVADGEIMCLLGASGCGKTTTLRLAAGLEMPTRGSVRIAGVEVAADGAGLPPEARGIGLVFQDYALFPHLTVAGNVVFGLRHWSRADRLARTAEVLKLVRLTDLATRYPHELSGGQQQRVALARALAPKPKLILLDEPFSGLDARLRDEVRDETLHVLKRTGTAAVMVTHDAEEALFLADRIAVMRHGRIVQVGTPEELYFHPCDAGVAATFGEVNELHGTVEAGEVATPFGPVHAPSLADGTRATVLIRPEGLTLAEGEGVDGEATVITARMLGRTTLVHLCTCRTLGEEMHLHARVPGRYLPPEQARLKVALDPEVVFVFPAKAA